MAKVCATCTYFDGKHCTNPALLQDGSKLFRPPSPEFVSPFYLDKETALLDRLVNALGIVRESGPSGETLVLPDGARFPAKTFKPHQDIVQVAHLWHLARTRGIFVTYGPEPDKNSSKWWVQEAASGIRREAYFYTAPRIILEMIVARLENEPAEVDPDPEQPTPELPPAEEPPPTITSFTATPSRTIQPGEDVALSWEVEGAAMLDLSDVGDVLGWAAALINPSYTTTYTLTAINQSGGTATAEVTVTVEEAPVDEEPVPAPEPTSEPEPAPEGTADPTGDEGATLDEVEPVDEPTAEESLPPQPEPEADTGDQEATDPALLESNDPDAGTNGTSDGVGEGDPTVGEALAPITEPVTDATPETF